MNLDAYASCPCGSGKKFKWCCQPIHADIEKAFAQHNAGQHEAAYQAMQAVVTANPGSPEAWGRNAQLLALNGKIDEAEVALEKAFSINPNYAFGYLIRGQIRLAEGETVGALLLFRKATEVYSPDAHDPLSYVNELIADIELRRNRPVAALAAFRRAMHLQPANAEIRQAYEELFGEKSRLPACAKKEYTLMSPPSPPSDWSNLLATASTGKLSDAVTAFAKWTEAHPTDIAGWYNLGIVRAWVGDNAGALEALNKYVELEQDEAKAAEAWALCEVLRCAADMLDDCDYAEHRAIFQVKSADAVSALIEKWASAHRVVGLQADPEQGLLTGLILEAPSSLVETAEPPAFGKLAAYLLVGGSIMQLWHSNLTKLDAVVAEAEKALGEAPAQRSRFAPMFSDTIIDATIFPTRRKSPVDLDVGMKVREAAANYFEGQWIHKPIKSLSGVAPIDAAGHKTLRKKLRGLIAFLRECAATSSVQLYDFDRLRRKLGLLEGGSDAATDIDGMSAAELSAMSIGEMTDEQLAQAFRAAIKLDAPDIAGSFARALADRPASGNDVDRFPFYAHLIHLAQKASRLDNALDLVDEGEKSDCEHNEGRRRNDFELRRGQIIAKQGNAAAAMDVFERLIGRAPSELRYLETATKAMMDLKHPAAATLAEKGLSAARAQNNRDAEEYFLELNEAAKRLKA